MAEEIVMAASAGVGGEETPLSSPKSKVKFLVSHGGKILPRLPDGHLKYVGGETRVVVVPRDIELTQKLNNLANGEMVLKYQVIPEDLDILVSVKCDEDLRHMLNEYDRWDVKSSESGGAPRLRAFLFPVNPLFIDTQNVPSNFDRVNIEQRYINAINGANSSVLRRSSSNGSRSIFSISSTASSPRSIQHEGYPFDTINHDYYASHSYQNNCNKGDMHRVNSSPSLHHYNQIYQATKPHHVYKSGAQHLVTAISADRHELGRFHQLDPCPIRYYTPNRQSRGRCSCIGYGDVDHCSVYKSGNVDL
ncbi:hypothetical protein MKW94_012055 [Papaver nudicaule]|uniref:PB1 domain-containing protein n=1 Tax=Papaver nudicaule TaxID=74823 RepID=A0AA41VWD6_PAPNU|nr:hypothetical protein [Papaver nudicaule]